MKKFKNSRLLLYRYSDASSSAGKTKRPRWFARGTDGKTEKKKNIKQKTNERDDDRKTKKTKSQ